MSVKKNINLFMHIKSVIEFHIQNVQLHDMIHYIRLNFIFTRYHYVVVVLYSVHFSFLPQFNIKKRRKEEGTGEEIWKILCDVFSLSLSLSITSTIKVKCQLKQRMKKFKLMHIKHHHSMFFPCDYMKNVQCVVMRN